MQFLVCLLLAALGLRFLARACATPFDALRSRTESLGEMLLLRASWKDPWLNLIPKDTYPKGAGYVRSSFTIGRSEPTNDEETWAAIAAINGDQGACTVTYNDTYVGMKEDTYKPEVFGLVGPLICQDDLAMYWQSAEFWEKYFQALEKRNRKSIINRLGNVYMEYSYKASANASFAFTAGNIVTQPAAASVTMTDLDGANIPTSELTQEMLDTTAVELMEEGADEPNSNGWITQGPDGPEFPLYIGSWMSHRLLLNNSELRSDVNAAFQGLKNANPVIQRLGATRVIKNFRHIINRFPPRWTTQQVNTTTGVVSAPDDGLLKRVPVWKKTSGTKGYYADVNPYWRSATYAPYEGCQVLNPNVMTEEILSPVNTAPGMKWKPQNYFGEWQFVTGNDAVLGFDDCAGIQDPLHTRGRHFAQYRHAIKPKFPIYGRFILFKRCADAFDTVTCS